MGRRVWDQVVTLNVGFMELLQFNSIKNQTRDDVLASLRIPPQLMGIVPQNAGGFGSIREATELWIENELEPIQARFMQINNWIGEDVVKFRIR